MIFKFVFSSLVLYIFCLSVQAQISFVDAVHKQGIPALNVYHKNGTLIGFTDKDGIFNFLEGAKESIPKPWEVVVQHVSYERASFTLLENQKTQILELIPRTNTIAEIVVDRKHRDVVVLRGYYRALETFNLQHKYYSDGIIVYYIPLTKGKMKYQLIDYRVYRDSSVVRDYDKKMSGFFQIQRVPSLSTKGLLERLEKLNLREESNTGITKILKNDVEVGNIRPSSDGETMQYFRDGVLPDSIRHTKIFRLEAKIKNAVNLETFVKRPLAASSPADLQNIYQNVVGSIKRKNEYGHIPYEGLAEFYVMERSFLTAEEYKKIEKQLERNIYKTPMKSQFKRKFWEDLKAHQIPDVSEALGLHLGTKLKLIE
ncbi:hypothetical protein E2P86_08115 [Sphingobacterium psychroaquaticum]|uniref:hypothetical protein n=1 Tax=Sphingobacterium psychroaquaticum TaxID=561061 RepID=UPI00106B8044|nr:hypothetical protein [Sphingobacterium psychroaquaticum]QBQ41122.1 hypothetical protein E2P86_08115 [Sphingobacterium psychroaquaticum]